MTAVVREHIRGGVRGTRLVASLAPGANSLTVEPGGLASWPDGSLGLIPVILDLGAPSEEHLYATGKAGDTLIGLVRGQDGTADQPHAANATVIHGLFASHIDRANELLSLPTGKGDLLIAAAADDWRRQGPGANGSLLIADSTQPNGWRSGTNPAITDFTAAGHTHLDAAGGGLLTQAATHASADTDTAPTALHHTLGGGANQAAPGNHNHADTAWTAFTPGIYPASGGGAVALGAGSTAAGQYKVIGNLVVGMAEIRFGTGGVPGTGDYRVNLPVAVGGLIAFPSVGGGNVRRAAGSSTPTNIATFDLHGGVQIIGTAPTVRMFTNGGPVSATFPFTWGTSGDAISYHFLYPAA